MRHLAHCVWIRIGYNGWLQCNYIFHCSHCFTKIAASVRASRICGRHHSAARVMHSSIHLDWKSHHKDHNDSGNVDYTVINWETSINILNRSIRIHYTQLEFTGNVHHHRSAYKTPFEPTFVWYAKKRIFGWIISHWFSRDQPTRLFKSFFHCWGDYNTYMQFNISTGICSFFYN